MTDSPRKSRVLVVDDEPLVAGAISRIAESFGHQVVVAESVKSAIERFEEAPVDVVLTDVRLGTGSGLDILRYVQSRSPEVPVVLITGQATIGAAMEAIHAGAYDYLAKPPEKDKIRLVLKRAVERKWMAQEVRKLQRAMSSSHGFDSIVGRSPKMLDVYKRVARVAPSPSNVLILGESGTGKELVARALHAHSDRSSAQFVPVNMAAINEGVLESELFGHVRGAFTGATSSRHGLFREAHQGTLFLDEISDVPMALQAKLLRAIQENRIKPVGGNEEVHVDVRLVVATHRDLEAMVAKGEFRSDLYFRLNVVSIQLPPLRERTEDVPALIDHFLDKLARRSGTAPQHLSEGALEALMRYSWPGNVRELENVVEQAAALSSHGVIDTDVLPPSVLEARSDHAATSGSGLPSLKRMMNDYVEKVLQHTGGNVTRAAQILGVSRRTLHRMAQRRRYEQ